MTSCFSCSGNNCMTPDVDAELERIRRERKAREARHNGNGHASSAGLNVWNAGDDTAAPPPRGWLLGNTFCRRFLSSLFGDGGVGKTALRDAEALSLATQRQLTGEHVFCRCRVLIVSLEDDADEL